MAVIIAALVSAFLLALVFYGIRSRDSSSRARRSVGHGAAAVEKSCPLCHSALGHDERVNSSLFPGRSDRIMHIFGCPHCWPVTPSTPRICPVCNRALGAQGWVIARYFESPGRRHVHVLGCTGCHG